MPGWVQSAVRSVEPRLPEAADLPLTGLLNDDHINRLFGAATKVTVPVTIDVAHELKRPFSQSSTRWNF